jgi:hypothetical protein
MKKILLLFVFFAGLFMNNLSAQTVSLYSVKYNPVYPNTSPDSGKVVTTGGIVTAVNCEGYYMQTTNAHAWAGVVVYDKVNLPVIGDSILITGTVTGYYSEVEITPVTAYAVVKSGCPLPAVTVVGFNNIQNREYSGLLVKVKHATKVRYNAAQAWYVFTDTTAVIDTVDNNCYTYAFTNKAYDLTGVIHYEYKNWLEPRNQSDIDSVNVTGIEDYQNEFSGLSVYPNPSNGLFAVTMTVKGDAKNADLIITDLQGRLI